MGIRPHLTLTLSPPSAGAERGIISWDDFPGYSLLASLARTTNPGLISFTRWGFESVFIRAHPWLNFFPRLRLFQEINELPQGGRESAVPAVEGGHRHGVLSVFKRHGRQFAPGHFVAHQAFGQNRHAGPHLQRQLKRINFIKLVAGPAAASFGQRQGLDQRPPRQLRPDNEGFTFQLRERDQRQPGERVFRQTHQLERHFMEGLDGQSRQVARAGDEAQVRLVAEDGVMDVRHGFVIHLDVHLGQHGLEPVEQGWQAVQADAGAGGHVEGDRAGRPDPGHLNLHFVGQPDNAPAFCVGNLAGGIQLNAAEAGLGERGAEGLFHGVELVAGIGRGAIVQAGGVGEASSVRHVNEHPQGSHFHNATGITEN